MNGSGIQGKIGLRFSEKMSGYLAPGEESFEKGERIGKAQDNGLSFEVTISVEDVSDFCKLSGRRANLKGTVSYRPLGQNLPIRNGTFMLFRPAPDTGKRNLTYSFVFTGGDGKDYYLYGYKVIYDDPHKFDVIEDLTRLYTRIHKGTNEGAPLFGSGILNFPLQTLPSMLASFEVTGTTSLIPKMQAVHEFAAFCYGEVRDTYLSKMSPIYYTEYENLVLGGGLRTQTGEEREFFFFSGVHDKDFPWGDDEVFWDIAFIVRRPGRGWDRYVLTDRIINGLELDIDEGIYRYTGPLYRLLEGYRVWKSDLSKTNLPSYLRKVDAKIEIQFDYSKFDVVDVPFASTGGVENVSESHKTAVSEILRHFETLGWHMRPHKVKVRTGKIILLDGDTREEYAINAASALGEAEKSTFQNIRWPKLYYNYFCALTPPQDRIYVKVRSGLLRGNRKDVLVDKILQELGKIVGHVVTLDLEISGNACRILSPEEGDDLPVADDEILEINNDHFPTAVFQRRVVAVKNRGGGVSLAMEEDMDLLNLGSRNSDRVAKVAAIKGDDAKAALDEVLDKAGFFGRIEEACGISGKRKEDFSIVVKPNFMFMYSVKDRSTFTDPALVEHLMDRMAEKGYRNLICGEARSTLGVFFTNREVKTVARHIGLSERNYRVVDLSEDLEPYSFSGKLGEHFVNRDWKNADFRVCFAKNKTHAYAYYTLTIKDAYGALPMENKFLEYHHRRDIFSTTIEFIRHFPIHFALIDAWVSADGPFGVFADKRPNETKTIIGSESIVACDWIGASKMGLDPLVSDYMKLAVEAFGKPKIELAGDRSLYTDWINVMDSVPLAAFGLLDRNYYFGNLFYSIFAYMEDFFQYKDRGLMTEFARKLADPLKAIFFQKIENGGLDAGLNEKLFELFTKEK